MRNLPIIALCLLIASCGSEAPQTPPTPEVKPPAPVVETTPIRTSPAVHSITLAGANLQVHTRGSLAPNAQIDVSITQTGGTRIATFRVWIGDESGIGSMKIRTHSHGNSAHAHAQAPAKLPAKCALWIEVQTIDGASESGSIALQ